VAKRTRDDLIGNRSIAHFDVCIIGSGAGGGTAAHVLTAGGKNVLVLEAGPLTHQHLDDPRKEPIPLHSNDELKNEVRQFIRQISELEPRTFRRKASGTATRNDDVNLLPKLVGGAFVHADCKVPRFNKVDFTLKSTIDALLGATPGLAVPGFGADAASANFADWPFTYDELEPFYVEVEQLYGVQGADDGPFANPFASSRSTPYPMAPGVPMYFALKLADGAKQTSLFGQTLSPHAYPGTQASRPYDGRVPCSDCGLCSGYGCPTNSKGGPLVSLRKALLSDRCQLRYNAHVVELVSSGTQVTAARYVDGTGAEQMATADAFMLAASPIESARLCLLSGIQSTSDQIGRNLTFHLQTNVNGFSPERIHGQRGRAVTHGISDFRGVEPGGEAVRVFPTGGGPEVHLGGVCEFGGSQGLPISEDGGVYAFDLGVFRYGIGFKNAMRDLPLGQHLFGLIMQAEDAPQLSNRVDLDPTSKDVFGLPAPRITYDLHPYELEARKFYVPYIQQVILNAGSPRTFTTPCDVTLGAPTSRHVMGTLRMGDDPATSVVDANGKFHEVDNLYACDGSVFVTASGWNPTLTIMAVSAKIAHAIAGTPPVVG
jgi:choline dehydrogenase-like flavoprotein